MPREPRLARRPRPAVKLSLESVEDRIVPSTASMNPLATVAVASPPAVPSVAAVASFVVSTMDQVMTAEQQEVSSAVEIIRQVLTQEEAFIIQEVDSLFGIPTSPNPTFSTTARQSGSGTGSASGATTNPTPSVSSGSGSGSSATPTRPIVPKHGGTKAPSLKSGSGIGFDAGPGSGGGTGTIDGQVWLDNNGDGDLDDGEEGLPGITVWYCTPTGQQIASTTTDTNGDYQFTVSAGNQEEIEVIFPTYDEATIEDPESQIDSDGFSNVFTVGVGGDVNIPAGMRSMHVTTNADDPNAAIPKQITLRDAIETGNNGGGPEVTFAQNVTGSISLQAALPAIAASYDIVGPGASTLTVAGKANALNAYSIFTVNPSVTSKISGLTITGGYNLNGGGVNNSGDVTLYADKIVINNAAAYGGGVINGKSGILTVEGSDIYLNNVRGPGGGIANFGVAIISNGSQIFANNALSGGVGGGIYNANGGNMLIYGGTQIFGNTAAFLGGGVYNTGNFTMQGGSIASNDAGKGFYGGGLYNYVGSVTLEMGVVVQKNNAKEGAGMYLAVTSTTTLNTVTIQNNILQDGGAGEGIYQQIDQKNPANNAVVNETNVTDTDDLGGQPFDGP